MSRTNRDLPSTIELLSTITRLDIINKSKFKVLLEIFIETLILKDHNGTK